MERRPGELAALQLLLGLLRQQGCNCIPEVERRTCDQAECPSPGHPVLVIVHESACVIDRVQASRGGAN